MTCSSDLMLLCCQPHLQHNDGNLSTMRAFAYALDQCGPSIVPHTLYHSLAQSRREDSTRVSRARLNPAISREAF